MSLLGRIIVIIFALIVASLAAAAAVALAVLGHDGHVFGGGPGGHVAFVLVTFVGTTVIGAVGLLPLAILIAIAEAAKIRALLAYAIAGAVLLLAGYHMSGLAPPPYEESIDYPPPPISRASEIAAASGAVFGFAYWALAGRNAGRWRERRLPSA
jgi:hypothetical protein